eukprot:CAMPEP_0175367546 /NCGR_PEP_ID=MMETSP0095-20121207/19719_1 /TAXON_ID=311494 /ORGANISM="Alexandrium monilatum, Strain CCMP3105" /LENGTH=303 /DNA_ID=CAMNT_0016665609 /DNA_START=56 /DNA_END=964 /DNA_ORIENTATION=+
MAGDADGCGAKRQEVRFDAVPLIAQQQRAGRGERGGVHWPRAGHGLQRKDRHALAEQLAHHALGPLRVAPGHVGVGAHGRSARLPAALPGGRGVPAEVQVAHPQALRRAEDCADVEGRAEVVQHRDQGHARPVPAGSARDGRQGVRTGMRVRAPEVVRAEDQKLVVPQTAGVLPLHWQADGEEVPERRGGGEFWRERAELAQHPVLVSCERSQGRREGDQQGPSQLDVLVPHALDALHLPAEEGEEATRFLRTLAKSASASAAASRAPSAAGSGPRVDGVARPEAAAAAETAAGAPPPPLPSR